MANLDLKKWVLDRYVLKSIDWNNNAKTISKMVKRRQVFYKAFSFLYGFKISIINCKYVKELPSVRTDDRKPGSITNVNNDGTFDVKTGNGLLRITNYVIHAPDIEIKDIREFLEKSKISEPPVLTQTPFSTNFEANRWESTYQRLHIENLDELGRQFNSSKDQIMLDTNLREDKTDTMKDLQGNEKYLAEVNDDFISYLIAKLGLKKGGRVLDVGCGSGWACHLFTKNGLVAFGCDLSPHCINIATQMVPMACFFILDIFDLPKQLNLKGKFDLVFCRDVGIMQKIVDWNDETWISVGKALIELLTDNGVIYWVQMGNLSGKIRENGFSNPTIDTQVKYFEKIGYLIDLNIYEFQSFLLTKKPPNENLLRHIAQFNHDINSKIYTDWLAAKNNDNARKMAKVLYSQVSKIFLLEPEKRNQGLLLVGNNALARAYSTVCKELGLEYKIIKDDIKSYENFIGLTKDRKESVVIFTEESHRDLLANHGELAKSFDYIIMPFENMHKSTRQSLYLISGDHDPYFDSHMIPDVVKILLSN